MIIEEKKNLVSVLNPLAGGGSMLRISWSCGKPSEGTIAGFLVVYNRAGKNHEECLERLRGLDSGAVLQSLAAGGWLTGTPTAQSQSLVWAVPAGHAEYSVHEGTFRAPCRIEVWTVLEQEGELRVLYQGGPAYHRSSKLSVEVRVKEFQPAVYGGIGPFRRLKEEAVTGVELILSAADPETYEDGAAFYRLKSDRAKLQYPIAKAALGKPLAFVSSGRFQYRADDFEVQVASDYAGMYQL